MTRAGEVVARGRPLGTKATGRPFAKVRFNLADAFLRVGAVLLAWSVLQGESGRGGHEALRQDRPVPSQGMVAGAERSGDGR